MPTVSAPAPLPPHLDSQGRFLESDGDVIGNLWASTGEGVNIFAPDGAMIAKILTPVRVRRPPARPLALSDHPGAFLTLGWSIWCVSAGVHCQWLIRRA